MQATIIVRSDQDLLMLHPFHGIVILTATEFLHVSEFRLYNFFKVMLINRVTGSGLK